MVNISRGPFIFSSKLTVTDVPLCHIMPTYTKGLTMFTSLKLLLCWKNTAPMEHTYHWLSEVKAAVNHDVLQQFLICADTK